MDPCLVQTPRTFHLQSPPIKRKSQYNPPNPDKKKEPKKWTFGALFRRRKKSVETESSSQEEDFNEYRRSFISRKPKKSSKKNKKKYVDTFDHIVLPTNGNRYIQNHDGIMSEPNYNDTVAIRNQQNIFASIVPRKNGSVETSKSSHESLIKVPSSRNESWNGSFGSLDSTTKKRRERAKLRRDRIINDSSSDEGSTASSLLRIKSDNDSITKVSLDSNSSRRTRAARTERYIKRLSREDESILNKEAELKANPVVHLPATNVFKKPPVANRLPNSFNDLYGGVPPLQRTTPDNYYMPRQKSWSLDNNMNRGASPQEICYIPPVYPVVRPYLKVSPPLAKYPPPPPPRDPQRRVVSNPAPVELRPMSYAFENNRYASIRSINSVNYPPINQTSKVLPNRSNSDEHLQPKEIKRYITRNPKYQFFTDKIPRSRKPIHIVPLVPSYLSDSQVDGEVKQTVAEFWKQKEKEEIERKKESPNGSLNRRDNGFRPLSMVLEKPEHDRNNPPIPPIRRSSRQNSNSSLDKTSSPVPAPRTINEPIIVKEERKSTNLEDALNELEEIYKSLHLGDEDLLDRAERRDIPTFTGIRKVSSSSSTESYEVEESTNVPPVIKHITKGIPDRVTDDMAYRKLRQNQTSPKDGMLSQISYLLTSPDLSIPINGDSNEPDITLDDVVYRNFKHVNNSLKVQDPQPPFGIPVGPVTAAANSDYLHAKPESRIRSRFIPQKIPDIVKDDLAFRSLRKDQIKDPLLPDGNNNYEARKKRAVRSLSANLYNLIQKDYKDNISDSELNQRLRVHIPKGGEQKNDTDIEITIQSTRSPEPNSELQTMLINLAKETQEELQELSDKALVTKKTISEIENVSEHAKLCEKLFEQTELISTSPDSEKLCSKLLECVEPKKPIIITKSLQNILSEIDAVSAQAQNCGDMLECVVQTVEIKPNTPEIVQIDYESDDNRSIPRIASTELLVEDAESVELLSDVDTSVANVILVRKPDSPTEVTLDYVDSDRLSVIKSDMTSSATDLSDEDRTIGEDKKSPFEVQKQSILNGFAAMKLEEGRTISKDQNCNGGQKNDQLTRVNGTQDDQDFII